MAASVRERRHVCSTLEEGGEGGREGGREREEGR